jgi:hypothetical protein
VRQEYRELEIPLGFTRTSTVHGSLTDRGEEARGRQAARERYAALVKAALHQAGADGLQPEHPIDFDGVAALGRLRVRTQVEKQVTSFAFGDVRATTITHTYEAVAIRLCWDAPSG